MYIDGITRDIRDIIHDSRQASSRAYQNHCEADRVLTKVAKGEEGSLKSCKTVSDGLVDASEALDKASEDFDNLVEMLDRLIYDIEMEALSAKVQSK
jgi:hypothetical protein